MKKILNDSLITLALIGCGIFISLVALAYVYSIAQPIIDDTIYGVSAVIGYGMIALSFVAMACSIAIISAFSGRVVGSQWFSFLIMKAQARKELLQSEFEFEVLEEGQQGFVLSRPGADLVGRNASLEAGPFSSTSLPNDNPVNLAKWQLLNSPKLTRPAAGGDVPLLETQTTLPLLPAIAHADNLLIVGGKGTGKTTLMQWLESERIEAGQQNIILDSHALPGQWQGQMVGQERNYSNIRRAMVALVDKLDMRYQKRTRGENMIVQNVFIDEFTLLPKKMKSLEYNIQDFSIPLLTEGRKVKLNSVWGIHSDRVGPMGLAGAGDMKESFDVVVYLKNVKGERYAICDFGEGKEDVHYAHPGPFVIDNQPSAGALPDPELTFVVADEPDTDPEPDRPSEGDMAIIEAVAQVKMDYGKVVFSKVTALLKWTATGPNNQRIKAVLDRWNISY